MKRTVIAAFIFLLSPVLLWAGSLHGAGSADTLVKVITKLTKGLDSVDRYAIRLSVTVSRLPSGSKVSDSAERINEMLRHLQIENKAVCQELDSFNRSLKQDSTVNFDEHYQNYQWQYQLMYDKISSLIGLGQVEIYAAQIDYTENGITNFISTLANFKLYLLGLVPPAVSTLLTEIKKRLDQTDTLAGKRSDNLNTAIGRTENHLTADVGAVSKQDDVIISLLKETDHRSNNVIFSAYSHSLFGFAYMHRIGSAVTPVQNILGVELLIPAASTSAKNPGSFFVYGVRRGSFILETGAGYLKTTKSAEDISWKFGVLFTPGYLDIGLNYSPLTGPGVRLGYEW